MSNNNHQIESKPGICICTFDYYFWMSVGVSVLSLLLFPVIQFIYGVDLRNIDTSIEGVMITIADWLLADGLISFLTGIMAMIIIKHSNTVPNLLKIIFNSCMFFLACWTVLGTVMLFRTLPIAVQGLAVIYNYIMLTAYIAYFIVSIKYKDHVLPTINKPHNNEPNGEHNV